MLLLTNKRRIYRRQSYAFRMGPGRTQKTGTETGHGSALQKRRDEEKMHWPLALGCPTYPRDCWVARAPGKSHFTVESCGRDDLGGRHGSHALQGLVLSCLVLRRHRKEGPEQGHQPGSGEASGCRVKKAVQRQQPERWTRLRFEVLTCWWLSR